MNNLVKKIFTIIVSLLVLAVPVAVVWGITSQMNKNSDEMSISEARTLVAQVCAACCGMDDISKISPAAVEAYNHDKVETSQIDANAVFFLLKIYNALEDDAADEGYLVSEYAMGNVDCKEYLAYKLNDNSIIVDTYTEGEGYLDTHFNIKISKNGNDWEMIVSCMPAEYSYTQFIARGTDFKVMFSDRRDLICSDSFTRENVMGAFYGYIDAGKHQCESNYWGENAKCLGWSENLGVMTDAQINELFTYFNNANYWLVDFTQKTLKKSDFGSKAYQKLYEMYARN